MKSHDGLTSLCLNHRDKEITNSERNLIYLLEGCHGQVTLAPFYWALLSAGPDSDCPPSKVGAIPSPFYRGGNEVRGACTTPQGRVTWESRLLSLIPARSASKGPWESKEPKTWSLCTSV